MSFWTDAFSNMEVRTSSRKLKVATAASIRAFERTSKTKLPKGFCEFSKVFGAGAIGGWYYFSVPLGFRSPHDLETENAGVQSNFEIFRDDVSPKYALDYMYFFGSTGGGDLFAWRTDSITDATNNEYEIYFFRHEGKARRVSHTFQDFFAKCRRGRIGGIGHVDQCYSR